MDKALEMGKTSATGSFHLLIGVAGSTIIMAIGTLVLAALLPASDVGLYGMAFIPSSIINYFRDCGVNSAMTQQIASLRASGKESEIHDVILSGIIFEFITGIILSLVCFAVAQPIAYIISTQNRADTHNLSIYISIMSLSIFAGAITAAASAIFTGFERMKLNSITQIFQAVIKTALGPLLIVIGFGVLGAVYAATASAVAGGVVGFLIAYFALYRPLRNSRIGKSDIKKTLKSMLKYGLPLTFSNTSIGVLPQVFAISMAAYAGSTMMGNYYAAAYFSVLLTFISIPIGTALFPAFSKIKPKEEPELVKTVFAISVKYTSILLVPATMALIVLASPLINTLFPQKGILTSLFIVNAAPKFPQAPLFLIISSIINLLALAGSYTYGTFQTGIGKTGQLMKQSAVTLGVGLPLAYVLVAYFDSIGGPTFAVIGGILGVLIANIPSSVWGLYWCWKHYGAKADFGNSTRIFAASAIAAVVTTLFISLLALPYVVLLIAGFVVFLVVYLAAAPLLGAVNRADIENFKAMFAGSGIISKILNIPLLFMQKLCRVNKDKETNPSSSKDIETDP